jgi:hypothetical protein
MWHLMVGLDTLPRQNAMPEADRRIRKIVGPLGLEVSTDMERAASATWAGDVGSALGDWMVGPNEGETEPSHSDPVQDRLVKLDHYWNDRCHYSDLDSDVMTWGVVKERQSLPATMTRVSDLLLHYFATGNQAEKRRAAFQEFIRFYEDPANPGRLPFARTRKEITEFAQMWLYRRRASAEVKPRFDPQHYEQAADELTRRFIQYVETSAR